MIDEWIAHALSVSRREEPLDHRRCQSQRPLGASRKSASGAAEFFQCGEQRFFFKVI